MTTNDATNDATYYARRGRLRAAGKGATVTIPDGWEAPTGAELDERQLAPGDRFTNDGSGDDVPWRLNDTAYARNGRAARYWDAWGLARLGLDVDPADDDQDDTTTATGEDQTAIIAALGALPVGSTLTFDAPRDFTPGADRNGIDSSFRITGLTRRVDGWDAPGVHTGNADWTVTFALQSRHLPGLGVTADDFDTPDAGDDDPAPVARRGRCRCPFCTAIRDSAPRGVDLSKLSVTPPAVPALDEYQRERVVALDEALRVLEARRAPETADKERSFVDVFAPTGRPMVKPADLINVAAFIADGTIPGGEQA